MNEDRKKYFFDIWTKNLSWAELDEIIILIKALRRSEDNFEYNQTLNKLFYTIQYLIPKPTKH